MFRSVVLALLVASASAFAPLPVSRRAAAPTITMNSVQDMPGIQAPIGFFDPVGYSTTVSPEAMLWFRAAELKHSRVAMLAFVGWCVNGAGWHFPGQLSSSVKFEDLAGLAPRDAWEACPEEGKLQIIGFIGVLETVTELIKPHYTKAGKSASPPMIKPRKGYFNPAILEGAELLAAQNKELSNGRLAMIGMMGFSAATIWKGSVPILP
mmetsp:Transcript_32431/g.75026  ORF Transcript_32431/g.75026 Transcript_32431/m.75026 type:complete len:209 (-) Transcript_32431:255-881(-)